MDSPNPFERAHVSARDLCHRIANAVRPLLPANAPDFRMLLTVSIRGRNIRVEAKPEPYRDPGFKDTSG